MMLAALYLLAMVDGAFCGCRSACKRSAGLDKSARRQAMLRGALWAQIGAVITVGAVVLVWKLAPLRAGLAGDLRHAGVRLLWALLPFAAVALIVLLTVASRPAGDRSSPAVALSRRLARLRPLVAVAAVGYAIVPASRWESRALGALVLALMLALDPLLDRIANLQPTTE